MFQETRILFFHAVSPVHMGAGTAVGGLIDNPIQRERHTGHPIFAGSGIKGAIRAAMAAAHSGDLDIDAVFGPGTNEAHLHAGAVAFTDAQLLLFPVRSLRNAFVYATSPTALGRAERLLRLGGHEPSWSIPSVDAGRAAVASDATLVDGRLVLETFTFAASPEDGVKGIANWLADHAFPAGETMRFFKEKARTDLVVLSDEDFSHFVETGSVVEPHVRIDDASGTADEGGLFYSENLPPESVMIGAFLASRSRRNGNGAEAKAIADELAQALDDNLVQLGGDATTGRGQIVIRVTGGSGEER